MRIEDISSLNNELKDANPQEIIKNVVDRFNQKIALSSSMGAEDQVLTDMLLKIEPNARIFTLDTGRLFFLRSHA